MGQERLGGRSPLSRSIASRVNHPDVLASLIPSTRLCSTATRQRRESSCYHGELLLALRPSRLVKKLTLLNTPIPRKKQSRWKSDTAGTAASAVDAKSLATSFSS